MELVLALGIAMVFLAGIFALLSIGLSTSKEAMDDTTLGLVLREASNRIRGREFAASTNNPLILYFDNRGRPLEQTPENVKENTFCAIATPSALSTAPPHANLLAVVVQIYGGIAQVPNASIPGGASPKATFSLLVTSSAGKGWKQLDSSYTPKIDF